MTSTRLAHVVHQGTHLLALEYRGQLLSVPTLEQLLELYWSPVQFTEVADTFRHRVFSLGLAGLDEILDSLGDGDPPEEAILDPTLCLFLPPTVPNPGLIEFAVRAEDSVPRFRWGNARCLRGHEAPLPIPSDEPTPQLSVQIAAVLGEDLRHASQEQAARAIVGFAPLSVWSFPTRERVSPGWGSYRIGQMGPYLVVPDDSFDPAECSVNILVNREKVVFAPARKWKSSFAEMIAFASEGADLLAGDIVASGPIARTASDGGRALGENDHVTIDISGLGSLTGVIVRSAVRKPTADTWLTR